MKLITHTTEINIDVEEITYAIDDIFHQEITAKSGMTVNHDDIRHFVTYLIFMENERIREIKREEEELDKLLKINQEKYEKKIKNNKIVKNLNGIKNKFKYYILNYILAEDD